MRHPRSSSSTLGARPPRRAAAAVEFAVIAPLLFMLLLGIVEMGRMLMVQQVLTNCAREAARQAAMPGTTDAEIQQTVDNYMEANSITGYSKSISPDPASATAGASITVTVSVPYNQVSWLPLNVLSWMDNKQLSASVVMRKE